MTSTTSPKILPASEWAPIFAYYAGTSSRKYSDGQIEQLARQSLPNGWCNLCDAPCTEDKDAHVRQHLRDLRAWRKQRGVEIEREGAQRLANARAEKRLLAEAGIA